MPLMNNPLNTESLLTGGMETSRKQNALRSCLGPEIVEALSDDQVVEVLCNPDGKVWADAHQRGRYVIGTLPGHDADNIVRLVADRMGVEVDRQNPSVSGILPTGERFQGALPPLVANPTFTIRKRSVQIFTLDDYQQSGTMQAWQVDVLRQAVAERKNILVVGGTGSGKTTLCNALLADEGFRGHRVVIIEDTAELQCAAEDCVPLLVSRSDPEVTMRDLLRLTMRLRPDRIVVGEVRGGEALDLVKAWNTGHPGGLGTLHADSAMLGLRRLESLIGEVAVNVDRHGIGEAVDYVVFVRRTDQGRRVEEIIRVDGFDPETAQYSTHTLERHSKNMIQ